MEKIGLTCLPIIVRLTSCLINEFVDLLQLYISKYRFNDKLRTNELMFILGRSMNEEFMHVSNEYIFKSILLFPAIVL